MCIIDKLQKEFKMVKKVSLLMSALALLYITPTVSYALDTTQEQQARTSAKLQRLELLIYRREQSV